LSTVLEEKETLIGAANVGLKHEQACSLSLRVEIEQQSFMKTLLDIGYKLSIIFIAQTSLEISFDTLNIQLNVTKVSLVIVVSHSYVVRIELDR
jgi:hypothetical protein